MTLTYFTVPFIRASITRQGNSNNQTLPQATVSQPPTESQERSEPRKQITPDHQKFNVVMHGVKKSPPNTNRPTRLDNDMTNITHAFPQTEVPLERNSSYQRLL